MSQIEIKLQFPYIVPTQHEHRRAADTHLQYNCIVHKNKTNVALNLMLTVGCYETPTTFFHLISNHNIHPKYASYHPIKQIF